MKIEQFVMAYLIEQDKIRAMLPDGFESLRPVLRINTEIRDNDEVYIEFNTPVEAEGKRGWLNIDNWSRGIELKRAGNVTYMDTPFFHLEYEAAGILGGCPAEPDNDGCFYLNSEPEFRPAEIIREKKEFCDCSFSWKFETGDAHGKSSRETLPAFNEAPSEKYPRIPLTAKNAAAIPCIKVLGTYIVKFER